MRKILKISVALSVALLVSSASAQTAERVARSVNANIQTTAETKAIVPSSSRSARGVATAPSSARSARGVAQPSSARSARSTTAPSSARSGRQAVQTIRTTSVINPPAQPRAAVSRAGITSSVPVSSSPVKTASETSTATINYAELIPTEVSTKGKTAEEVATLLANELACKEQYVNCMDQFCKDTSDDSVGRCLCSSAISAHANKEKELNKIFANITQVQWQTKNLSTAKAKAEAEGKEVSVALKEVTDEAIKELGISSSSSSLSSTSTDDIYEIFLGDISNGSVKKEGTAKLKEAEMACQTMLEICPDSKKQIATSYSILAGNDCRVYGKELDKKIADNKVVLQNAYNQYQVNETQYTLGAKNKFNSEECSQELTRCMKTEEVCGEAYEYCFADKELENRKPLCQSVLNQCQGVNMPTLAKNEKRTPEKTDVLWNSFKKSVLARTQLTNQQCFEQSKACVERVCGDNYKNCTSGTLETKGQAGFLADIKTVAGVQCGEIVKRCAGDTTDPEGVWESIINGIIIRDTYTDQADQLVSDALYACMEGDRACGAKYTKCKTNTSFESAKSLCSENLMKSTRHETIWNNFKKQAYNGNSKDQCKGLIVAELTKVCGVGYTDCGTSSIETFKVNAMEKAGVSITCDFYDQEELWKLAKAEVVVNANKTNLTNCTAEGSYFENNICAKHVDYDACKNSGGAWTQSAKKCSCNAEGSLLQGNECKIDPVYTACLNTGKTWNKTDKKCNN